MHRSALLLAPFLALQLWGCQKPPAADAPAAAPSKDSAEGARAPSDSVEGVALPLVHEDNTSLLFYFLDERGAVKTVAKADEVPMAVRPRVLVVDVSQTPEQRQAHRYTFFADLTSKAADGSYAVVAVSRYDAAKGEGLSGTLPKAPEGSVIVYSAEWCGFCKKAKAWLTDKQVPFIERDVEKQPGASSELEAKLRSANIRGGGVPVIDWEGTVIMGFDQKRLQQLLERRRDAPEAPGQTAPQRASDDAPPGH